MRRLVRRPRPRRGKAFAIPAARPKRVARVVTRAPLARVERRAFVLDADVRQQPTFTFDPYLDYGRFLTAEGGILIVYKDIDDRLRHTLWRLFAWTLFTGLEGWYLFSQPPLQHDWLNYACLIVTGIINWLIVRKPVEVYRSIEIRPDCLILDRYDVFWAQFMEGWPTFHPTEDGTVVLCGTYGTRFVEFLTARRFDEQDRMPETFAAHLQQAMQQLWMRPS